MDRLGQILVDEGACPEEAVRDALKNQIIFGGRLGTNLLEIQAVTEEALARGLGVQHRLPSVFGALRLDPRATALLAPEAVDRLDALPYALVDRRLAVIAVDPGNLATLDEIAFATGKQVQPIVAPEARVWALLRQHYAIERHLRGIDVDFAWMKERIDEARGVPSEPSGERASSVAGDLMDEGAFDALYLSTGATPSTAPAPPRAATRDEEVVELTDLLFEPEPTAATPEPSPLSFEEAARSLEGVSDRDAIATAVLRYARSRFRRAVLLTVQRGGAHGWAALGEKLGPEAARGMHFALGRPGILETVVSTRAHFLGPIPKTGANIGLLRSLGGGVPVNAFVVPILALGRVVNVLYADNGRGGVVDATGVGELLILATRIAKSYDALLERIR